jgi:hypothetical protein
MDSGCNHDGGTVLMERNIIHHTICHQHHTGIVHTDVQLMSDTEGSGTDDVKIYIYMFSIPFHQIFPSSFDRVGIVVWHDLINSVGTCISNLGILLYS